MTFSLRRAFLAMILAAIALGWARYVAGPSGALSGTVLAICMALIVLFTPVSQIPRLTGLTLLCFSLALVFDVPGVIIGFVMFQVFTNFDWFLKNRPD